MHEQNTGIKNNAKIDVPYIYISKYCILVAHKTKMTFHTVDWWQWVMIVFMWILFFAFCAYLIDIRGIPAQIRDVMLQMAGRTGKVRIPTPTASLKQSSNQEAIDESKTGNFDAVKLNEMDIEMTQPKLIKTVRHVEDSEQDDYHINHHSMADVRTSAFSVRHCSTEEEEDEKMHIIEENIHKQQQHSDCDSHLILDIVENQLPDHEKREITESRMTEHEMANAINPKWTVIQYKDKGHKQKQIELTAHGLVDAGKYLTIIELNQITHIFVGKGTETLLQSARTKKRRHKYFFSVWDMNARHLDFEAIEDMHRDEIIAQILFNLKFDHLEQTKMSLAEMNDNDTMRIHLYKHPIENAADSVKLQACASGGLILPRLISIPPLN